MLTGPARLSAPMARLRRQAMTCGPVPARSWEASSAKVTSRTQCRPFSIAQCPRMRSASRAGLGVDEAGDRVDGHGPPPPPAKVAGLAGDLEDLGGVGEPEPGDRDGLEGAQLDPPVGAVAGAVQHGHVVPGQAGAPVQERGLVGLDGEQVVGLLAGDEELGGVGVGVKPRRR